MLLCSGRTALILHSPDATLCPQGLPWLLPATGIAGEARSFWEEGRLQQQGLQRQYSCCASPHLARPAGPLTRPLDATIGREAKKQREKRHRELNTRCDALPATRVPQMEHLAAETDSQILL